MRSLTNSIGTPTDEYDYTAFGELSNHTGSSDNLYLYTGQQFDAEIDLYSLRARYYDPSNGRFLSKDTYPIDLQNPVELNRYVYTANNPVNFVDPSGLSLLLSKAFTTISGAFVALKGKYTVQGFLIRSFGYFVLGGVLGAVGYFLALVAYNAFTGNNDNLIAGRDDNELAKAVLTGAIIGTANFWIGSLEYHKLNNIKKIDSGWGIRSEKRKLLITKFKRLVAVGIIASAAEPFLNLLGQIYRGNQFEFSDLVGFAYGFIAGFANAGIETISYLWKRKTKTNLPQKLVIPIQVVSTVAVHTMASLLSNATQYRYSKSEICR